VLDRLRRSLLNACAHTPVARGLYLCDYHIGYENGKTDLYGQFNAIHPKDGFPHEQGSFCVFAQLTNGLGKIPFFVDIRDATSDQLVWTTSVRELNFATRNSLVQLALQIEGAHLVLPVCI
jgi:hypothetical protein